MAIFFFDSSAIVKYYVREQGSDWVTRVVDPLARHHIHVARVSGVEVIAAITKRIRIGHIASEPAPGPLLDSGPILRAARALPRFRQHSSAVRWI